MARGNSFLSEKPVMDLGQLQHWDVLCKEQPTPVSLPGKFHGRRNLAGYSPWGRKELDMTEGLHFRFM